MLSLGNVRKQGDKLVRTLLLALLIVFSQVQAATLTLAFDTPGIEISTQEQLKLIQRVAEISNADIRIVTSGNSAEADLLLTTRPSLNSWIFSQIVVSYVPSLIALSLQDVDLLSGAKIAQLPRAYTLADNDVDRIPVDSNVLSLLQAKRYDVIVEVSSGVFQHDIKSQLYRRSLYPGRYIRLAMKNNGLKDGIEQLAQSHANTEVKLLDESARPVKIQLIAKSFNPDKYLLQETTEDLGFFSLLQQQLPQSFLTSVVTSTADAAATLQQPLPACIVNYRKRADRDHLIFSLPTQVYLGPRLYVAKTNPLVGTLTALLEAGAELSFQNIARHAPMTRLATLEALKQDVSVPNAIEQQHHFLPLLRFDSSVSLLQRNRVDGLWIYPVMFRFSLDDVANASDFSSFILQETAKTTPVYLACNNTVETHQLIENLNQLLSDARFLSKLLTHYSIGLNPADAADYSRQYRQALKDAAQ